MESLEEKFKKMHLLSREERIQLSQKLRQLKPDFLKPYVPKWWWWRKCKTKVLIVCDGGLNFGTEGFDLSEFLTTFNELEAQSFVNYELTLAHRGSITMSPNPVVVNHISNFNFATSVNLDDFDQVWLFAISSFGGIGNDEVQAIEAYMNGGGGLFATGDHGSLGRAMCDQIPRVKDMRHWDNTPVGASNDANEVSMGGRRRNDTNKPRPGNSSADTFDHQSDNVPQTIAVRTFGSGLPHPLLSIKKSLRPSGIIDIMPDHPHEGECSPETTFTVNGTSVKTQIIATSFVPGGNTSGGKDATDPHCFPSISVWDGRQANAGRIVIDSTWHHFVNINLNGEDALPGGLDTPDFEVIRQYYMNIATWMTRRKFILCWRRWVLVDLLQNSQLVEASLNHPTQKIEEIDLAELKSIGALAEEILSSKFSPSFARELLIDFVSDFDDSMFQDLNIWKPDEKGSKKEHSYYENWINSDLVLHTAIGSGFIRLRDEVMKKQEDTDERFLDQADKLFVEGMKYGYSEALADLEREIKLFRKKYKRR